MLGLMVRDHRASKSPGRRQSPARGAVRVVPPAPRNWSPLSLRLPKLKGMGDRIQQLMWPVLLVLLAVGLYALGTQLMPQADRPISVISVEGDLQYIDRDAVQDVIQPYLNESFLGIDIDGLSAELNAMSWVAEASVKRVWPDRLVVNLDEQLPVARWGDTALLNNAGEAFAPEQLGSFEELPRLTGPDRAKRRVMQNYQQFNRLLRPYGHGVAELELRERGSWFMTTRGGIQILLGREDVVEKMKRFLTIDQLVLSERRDQIARVDLRYSNSMAVAWHEPAAQDETGE